MAKEKASQTNPSAQESSTMSVTEQLLQKYPEHLVNKVRQNLDLEKGDTSMDDTILNFTRSTFLNRVLLWEGFIGYGTTIREWVGDVYGIELGSNEVTFQDPEKGQVVYRG